MDVDLFIKKMPSVIKELIGREAFENRRSVNQEAISLLEEALVARVGASGNKRKRIEAYLEGHADTNPAATPADPSVMPAPPTSLMSLHTPPQGGRRPLGVARPNSPKRCRKGALASMRSTSAALPT